MTITIEIISPIISKRADKEHFANDMVKSEENYVELGCIVKSDGEVVRDRVVKASSNRDSSQSKVINGTGTLRKKFYRGERRESVYFYPFHYEFRTPGKHVLTFECEGVSASVDLVVKPKKP